jgi:alkaline phosphatase
VTPRIHNFAIAALALTSSAALFAQAPSIRLALPERLRLLEGQYVDLVVEVRNATAISNLTVRAGETDITSRFSRPETAQLDCDTSSDLVLRANLYSFPTAGNVRLTVSATVGSTTVTDSRDIIVRPFTLATQGGRKNIVLFIGDAMGTAYRDAARLVSRSVMDANGRSGLREGFFDNLLEMDKMPVSGMSMTYGSDSVVPDSANTGTAWATGNKTFFNGVNVFADGNDCRWRFTGQTNAANLPLIIDNPRVENLWQYLKRRHGYRTGIVTTADITDATPAVQGSYTGFRQTRSEIARQYLENPMLSGQPAFDVMLGGGRDNFVPAGRGDRRNLIEEFQARGYNFVENASQLRAVGPGARVLGLFRGNLNPAVNSAGVGATDSNMDVAYDKLGLPRPASEPQANLQGFNDQPMLDLMTQKAIEALSASFSGQPFILMVEAASIDKQSHPNQAAGTIWDTIEFDKSIGWARTWSSRRQTKDTLVVVTADHDQSMHIIGVSNSPDAEYFNRTKSERVTYTTPRGEQTFVVWGDSYSNARAGLPYINGSTGATNNAGPGGTPGSYAATNPASDPAASTQSTYYGFPAYPMDARTGYPLNTATGSGPLRRLAVGFRTGDHTGSSVPVTAEGPGALLFTGYMDQTDIFFKMAAALGDTADLDRALELINSNDRFPRTIGK